MNDFVNTIDILGEQVVEDALLEGTLTEFADNRIRALRIGAFQDSSLTKVNMPLLTGATDQALRNNPIVEAKLLALTAIGAATLANNSLTVIHFPVIREIGREGLSGCTKLETLILSSRHRVTSLLNASALGGTPIKNGTGHIYTRKKLLEQYKAATNWSVYAAQFRAIEDYPEIQAIVDADLAEMRGVA